MTRAGEFCGVLLLDKPAGITSFDAVRQVRRWAGERRVGHAGTLDPFATGLLPLGVGRAARALPFLSDGDKRYHATLALGAETDTGDIEGQVVARAELPKLENLASITARFLGRQFQIPPAWSAIHVDGERAYDRARRGESVEIPAREIVVHSLEITALRESEIDFVCTCSKGTYIRSLGRDMARALGTVGHLRALRRLAVGGMQVGDALPLSALEHTAPAAALITVERALAWLPAVELDADTTRRVGFGQRVPCANHADGATVRALAPDGALVAVCRVVSGELEVALGWAAGN